MFPYRPVWTLDSLTAVAPALPEHFKRVLPTLVGASIGNRLRERVMLGVASENNALYCKTVHGAVGRLSGLSAEEVRRLKEGAIEASDDAERLAVEFARDLARRDFIGRNGELYDELGQQFTEEERAAIESSAHVMNFFNRLSNLLVTPLEKL